jgi:hypothetical protein
MNGKEAILIVLITPIVAVVLLAIGVLLSKCFGAPYINGELTEAAVYVVLLAGVAGALLAIGRNA